MGTALRLWLRTRLEKIPALCWTPRQTEKKIHVTVDMSSITGGLCQNFGAASSVKQCAEILAHYEEEILMHNWNRNFGT